jgi:hypothetical protein
MKLVSFYCDLDKTGYYKESALRLKKQCELLNIESIICEECFGENWIDNVRAKPSFLLRMMNELKEDFVWLDIDCSIHKPIVLSTNCEWMFDVRKDGSPHDYVHAIKYSNRNLQFLSMWVTAINEQQRGSHTAFISIHKKLNYDIIPPGYTALGLASTNSKKKYFEEYK